MGDHIIDSINLGPFTLKVGPLLSRFGKKSPVEIVAARFINLFQVHGLSISQIPRLVPQIKLDNLLSPEALVPSLTPEVLEQASALFNIKLSWLEGIEDQVYDRKFCYKDPSIFFAELATLTPPSSGFALQVLATTRDLNRLEHKEQQLCLLLVEKAKDLGEQEILRYRVFGDSWGWSYYKCRIQIKAMVRVMFKYYRKPVPLHLVKSSEINQVLDGKRVPASLLGRLMTTPSLEDYALGTGESAVAKGTDELAEVLEYIQQHKLEKMMVEAYQRREIAKLLDV